MSISARKIEYKIIDGRLWQSTISQETFNCSHDEALNDYFRYKSEEVVDQTNMEGVGTMSMSISALKEAIDLAEGGKLEVAKDTLESLKKDYDTAIANGEDFITYDCF